MENVIEISGLVKKYGDYAAVHKLDLSIAKGEIFGLLGPNGAGKSTTMLMLMGLTEPLEGSINVCGIDPIRDPMAVKRKVGYLPEDVGFYDDYTGLENLIYTGKLNGLTETQAFERATALLEKVSLSDETHKKVGKYSRGMRQRLGLADVLMKNPEVIVLDEPTLGIDPSGVIDFLELIVELSKKEKITVLFSSHNLHQVQQVCDRVGIFVNGELLALGNIEDLSKKLFSENNFLIEGEVEETIEDELDLKNRLLDIEGVSKVRTEGKQFFVESKQNVASKVSGIIVHSGFGLLRLSKKVFGLDDIYLRYFQGMETS